MAQVKWDLSKTHISDFHWELSTNLAPIKADIFLPTKWSENENDCMCLNWYTLGMRNGIVFIEVNLGEKFCLYVKYHQRDVTYH